MIAGTGCASTKETIALTNKAVEAGIDMCMVVGPFYNKPTQEGIYNHYKTLAENTKAKIMLYNIPIFVGVNIDPETVGRLAEIENIIGIKDEAGINPTQVTDFFLATEKVDKNFAVYNGDDIMLLPTIVQGAMGIVSGGAHIFGKEIRAILKHLKKVRTRKQRICLFPYIVSANRLGRMEEYYPTRLFVLL